MKVNITNGEYFNNYITNQINEVFIPFNEAMIEGDLINPLFDLDFINYRSEIHDVSYEDYTRILSGFLALINNLDNYSEICLWFGSDVFCQINLYTILAYLDYKKYRGNIYLTIIDDYSFEIVKDTKKVNLAGMYKSYVNFIDTKNVDNSILFKNTLIKYNDLKSNNSTIAKYIKNHIYDTDLVTKVIEEFKDYGLTDLYINKLINKINKGNEYIE